MLEVFENHDQSRALKLNSERFSILLNDSKNDLEIAKI